MQNIYDTVKISRSSKTIVLLSSNPNIPGVTSTCFVAAKMEPWFKCMRRKTENIALSKTENQ